MTKIRGVTIGLLVALLAGEPGARGDDWTLAPFAVVVGGVKFEDHHPTEYADSDVPTPPDDERDRFFTLAVSQFGVRARMAGGFTLLSEFEANAGFHGHGSSIWEGQAALQARRQLIRFERWGLRFDAGHVQDDSSADYYSAHVTDQLLTDQYTRGPFLKSGFNHGNGLYATYDVWEGLGVGFTFNAGSPVTSSATPTIGGTYNPYSNFYGGILKALGDNPYRMPSQTQHFVLFAPSVTFDSDFLLAHASLQLFEVDVRTDSTDDDIISGQNVRLGARGMLLGGMLVPFINFSWSTNNVTGGARNPTTLEGEDWEGMTFGGGLDFNITGRSGIGVQYMMVLGRQGGEEHIFSCFPSGGESCSLEHYINVGGTYWLNDKTSLGARVGFYRFADEAKASGEISYFLTARVML